MRRALFALLLAGCPEGELPECAVSDASNAMIVASNTNSDIVDVHDGSAIDLIPAPQGGHILLVGARVRTGGDCQLIANAALRDPTSQRVIGLEERPLLLEKRSDGWAVPQPGLSSMPNVAVCPTSAVTTGVAGNTYQLEVTLLTMDMMPIATMKAMVTPTCVDSYCTVDCGPPNV